MQFRQVITGCETQGTDFKDMAARETEDNIPTATSLVLFPHWLAQRYYGCKPRLIVQRRIDR